MRSKSELKKLMRDFIRASLKEYESKKDISIFQSWHPSTPLGSQTKRIELVEALWSHSSIPMIYQTKENVEKAISSFLNFYAIEIKNFKFDTAQFSKVFSFFHREIFNPNRLYKIGFPSGGFRISERLKLDGEFEIVPLPQSGKIRDLENKFSSLLGVVGTTTNFYDDRMRIGGIPSALLIQTFSEKKEPTDYSCLRMGGNAQAVNRSSALLSSLRLFREGDIGLDFYYLSVISWYAPGVAKGSHFSQTNPFGEGYKINKSDISKLRRFRATIEPYFLNGPRDPQIDIALDFFNYSYSKFQEEERIIELMISIEALFGTINEATYRIALRMANFLASKAEAKKQIYREVKELYKIRSLIVHGRRPNLSKEELKTKRRMLENYVRSSLAAVIKLNRRGVKLNDIDFEEEVILDSKVKA